MTALILISVVSELIGLWCMFGLWRSRASVTRKICWTLVLLVPLFGPIFYGGMFELPSVQGEGFRAEDNWDGHHSPRRPDDGDD